METNKGLIEKGVYYVEKCSKHLFMKYAKHHPTYYHVYNLMKGESPCVVRLDFDKTTTKVFATVSRLDIHTRDTHEMSQTYFTPLMEAKAVRQNKFLKKRLEVIKDHLALMVKDKPTSYNYNFELELEKSGV